MIATLNVSVEVYNLRSQRSGHYLIVSCFKLLKNKQLSVVVASEARSHCAQMSPCSEYFAWSYSEQA